MSAFEKKGWYRAELPEGWEAGEEEGVVSFHHPEGAGALQATAQAPRPLKPGERMDPYLLLRAYLNQTGVDIHSVDSTRGSARGLDWARAEYDAKSEEGEDLSWRIWMLTNHDVLVFLTYVCRREDKDAERAAVDAIVASLTLG